MTVRLALRGLGAIALLGAAVVLALTAADVLSWRGQTHRASIALDRRDFDPGIWQPDTLMPVGLSRWLVGTDDEVAFGRGLQQYLLLNNLPFNEGASSGGAYQASQVRIAQTELALERLARRSLPPTMRSRAQQLAAIALFGRLLSGPSNVSQAAPLEQAQQSLARAIRIDPGNDAAKTDLEQLFQMYAQALNVTPEELRLHPNKASSKSRGGSAASLFGGGGY